MIISPEVINICKKKAFLVSKPRDCDYYICVKEKIEETKQIQIRRGASGRSLVDIPNEISIGAGTLITIEDLGFSHHKYDTDKDAYLEAFQQCAAATQFGVLIPVGTIENWKKWAASEACREEVKGLSDNRVFAYIEHQEKDAGGKKGYIIKIGDEMSWPTVRDGKGYILWRDGDFYEGEFQGNKKHGQGKWVSKNGHVYEGEWEAGKRHGKGKWVTKNGDIYEGEYNADKKHGKGWYHGADGEMYYGEWKDEKKDGHGMLRMADGSMYNGFFKNGKFHGEGSYMNASAGMNGTWKNGVLRIAAPTNAPEEHHESPPSKRSRTISPDKVVSDH